MVTVELVPPAQVPRHLDAFAICAQGHVVFVVRDDVTPARLAAAINRLGESPGP